MTNHVLPRKNPLPLGRGCLTEEIDENKIEAKFEDGVLKISIEEKEKIENDIKKIEIK